MPLPEKKRLRLRSARRSSWQSLTGLSLWLLLPGESTQKQKEPTPNERTGARRSFIMEPLGMVQTLVQCSYLLDKHITVVYTLDIWQKHSLVLRWIRKSRKKLKKSLGNWASLFLLL